MTKIVIMHLYCYWFNVQNYEFDRTVLPTVTFHKLVSIKV